MDRQLLAASTDAVAAAPLGVAAQAASRSHALQRRRFYVGMLAPTVIVLFAVTIIPTLYLIGTSFTSLTLSRPGSLNFIGLGNYAKMLHDERFLNSLLGRPGSRPPAW